MDKRRAPAAALVLLVSLILLSTPLHGERIEVPLPELKGAYSQFKTRRSAHFTLPSIPTEVYSVSIRLVGEVDVGVLGCTDGFGHFYYRIWPTYYDFAMLDDTSGNYWTGHYTIEEILLTIDIVSSFWSKSGATWDFLGSGEGDISFEWYPSSDIYLCHPERIPGVLVIAAYLHIHGDFPVPAEKTSWGRLKSIYSVMK
jgi:hypothetical protein